MRPAAPVPHLTARARHWEPHRRAGKWLLAALGALLRPTRAALVPFVAFAAVGTLLASTLAMPGVVTETGTRPGPGSLIEAPAATMFVVGLSERGPATAPTPAQMRAVSYEDWRNRFGDWVAHGLVADQVASYFGEGGVRVYFRRLVGPAATFGELMLKDRSVDPGLNTLQVRASSQGDWSPAVRVEVLDGSLPNTFTLRVYHRLELKEIYADLASPQAAVDRLAVQPSNYVTVAVVANATAAPANNPRPLEPTALSAGTDDRAALVDADYTAALTSFPRSLGTGVVCLPGRTSAVAGAALDAHCRATDRKGLLSTAVASTESTARAEAVALTPLAGSDRLGIFTPHVEVPDGAGGRRLVEPLGYVAGVRARAHKEVGVGKVPAGDIAAARYVLGLERIVEEDEANRLNAARVNVIRRPYEDAPIQLYGYRSLSADEVNWRTLKGRELADYIVHEGARALQPLVFGDVDDQGRFTNKVNTAVRSVVEPLWKAGFLSTRNNADGSIDPAFVIDTGPGVNTLERLQRDEVMADVGFRQSATAEVIRLRVTKVSYSTPLAA